MIRQILHTAAALAFLVSPVCAQDGAVNPNVTQENIHETICRPGWTKTVRPPASATNAIKWKLARESGVNPNVYELDHVIPLELGGAPLDPRNLVLQQLAGRCGARTKDHLEFEMVRGVCAGELALDQARAEIAEDWVEAFQEYIDPRGCNGRPQD
jgi:hypothetical protein